MRNVPTDVVVQYECHVSGVEHDVPGPDVRIMKVGDGGFVIGCGCGDESLDELDETPHPHDDHIVNVYANDPMPSDWLVLEDHADGWYDTTAFDVPEEFDGTNGQRRAKIRERAKKIADADDGRDLEETEEDRQARTVACPHCGATAGRKCKRPSGHRVRKPHAERVDAAVEAGHIDTGDDDTHEQSTLAQSISNENT